jgi:hypothetical protein
MDQILDAHQRRNLPPRNWPVKKAPTITGKVESCQPSPERIRKAMTKGTGVWTARTHGKENFLVPARQKPKGRFRRRTPAATVQML